jgi:hypothetical protein
MCLEKNRKIMAKRAEDLGFKVGVTVKCRRKTGVVIGFNPHCHDSAAVMIYVNFESAEKRRGADLVNVNELKIVECVVF